MHNLYPVNDVELMWIYELVCLMSG